MIVIVLCANILYYKNLHYFDFWVYLYHGRWSYI